MKIGTFLLAAASAAFAVPAVAGVTVVGNSSARSCYEATESRVTTSARHGLRRCDEALEREGLGRYDEVATYVNRGILKMRLGDLDEAVADFDRAMERDPDQAEAYVNKGMAMLLLDNPAAAVPLFDAAIAKETRRPAVAYFGRAVAHEMGGRVRQAYLDYKQASALAPKWSVPRTELARFRVVGR